MTKIYAIYQGYRSVKHIVDLLFYNKEDAYNHVEKLKIQRLIDDVIYYEIRKVRKGYKLNCSDEVKFIKEITKKYNLVITEHNYFLFCETGIDLLEYEIKEFNIV